MESNSLLRFPHKQIRAEVIRRHVGEGGKVVCFSCGNAAKALEEAGLDVLHIGPKGDLTPRKWFTHSEIASAFPDRFDATSGHLPMGFMADIASAFREHLGDIGDYVYVPTGSGETIACLSMAYPDVRLTAVYDLDEATEYSPHAPLNGLVRAVSESVVFANSLKVGDEALISKPGGGRL